MKKWYEMTKEELKDVISKEEVDLLHLNLDIGGGMFNGEKKAIEAVPTLIKAFREVKRKRNELSEEYIETFDEYVIFTIIRNIELPEDAINDIIEMYWWNEYLIYMVVRRQKFTEGNIERFLKRRSSDADIWYLYMFQNIELYPVLILENIDLNKIPPEYFETKFDWDEIFKEKLSPEIQKNLVQYLNSPNKGSGITDLEDDEFIEDYFEDFDDSDLWNDATMDERVARIANESYYDEEMDILYLNYWQYLLYRLIHTQEINEESKEIIGSSLYENEPQVDFCKKIVTKYGESEMGIFIKIYNKLKEDGVIRDIDYLNNYFRKNQ